MTLIPDGPIRRLAYLGTPEVAIAPLEALLAAGFEIPVVISRPDTRRGRGSTQTASPVKQAAQEHGLDVADSLDALDRHELDLAVVVAFGQLIPASRLARLPFVNLHFSLLPRWRGAAPVERAILAGDQVTGVCLMALEAELDTGPLYSCRELPIGEHENAHDLRGRLADVGADLLVAALRQGLAEPVPQSGEPTYAAKITSADRQMDWQQGAELLERQVRVGGAFTFWKGRRLKVHDAHVVTGDGPGVRVPTGDGVLQLLTVQPEGKAAMAAEQWAHGAHWAPGERFGS